MKTGAILLLALALISGRAPAAEKTIALATAERAPIAYYQNGRATGLLVDILQEAFDRMGQKVEFKLMPWPRCLAEARSGNVDAVGAMYRTPDREETFAFADEPALIQTESLFVRKGSPIHFDGNLATLAGKKAGTVYKTSYGPKLDKALAAGLFAHTEPQRNMMDLVKMLVHGRIDVLPGDRDRIIGAADQLGLRAEIVELKPQIETVPGYIGFTRIHDMSALVQSLEQALRAMKKDGAYDAILAKYPSP